MGQLNPKMDQKGAKNGWKGLKIELLDQKNWVVRLLPLLRIFYKHLLRNGGYPPPTVYGKNPQNSISGLHILRIFVIIDIERISNIRDKLLWHGPLLLSPLDPWNLWNPFNRIRIIMGKFGCTQIRTSSSCSSEKEKDLFNLFLGFKIFCPDV